MNDAISGWNDWASVLTKVENEWNDMNLCELHGFVSAIVTICHAPNSQEWQLLFENAFIAQMPEDLLTLITEEAEDIHELLKDTDDAYEYQPLLPDESHALIERLTGLVSWGNGFLSGYAVTATVPRKDEEELLLNLQQLARLKLSQDDLDEAEAEEEGSTEAQFEELLEFARIVPVSMSSMGEFKQVTKLPIIAGLPQERNSELKPN